MFPFCIKVYVLLCYLFGLGCLHPYLTTQAAMKTSMRPMLHAKRYMKPTELAEPAGAVKKSLHAARNANSIDHAPVMQDNGGLQ